ncbi:uncharacterized protein LOC120647638 isoform X2 [Panicum virgatum]|uniref:uncharacterized protein LOC120647638 isoform X2 n=1 Tax=Panicum virgatum TaxID=38727 RepID=UPI0019D5FA9E|nr:uncharacterized protein LOC120647638 isoform X2 [Panicum virgatum]
MQQLLELGQTPSPALVDPDPPPDRDDAAASSATQALPSRNASSKYDFVKVKVWLGENADHYYILSRFLLSRMLTVTKIPNHVAIKIALELKKLHVDNSLLDVSQTDLEANLFKLMEKRGYGEDYINRYKMMTRFHHQRVPLVILVCGTACTGKSTIATQLAQRLNLPNVLQTWCMSCCGHQRKLITEFCKECKVVRKGLAGDLKKAMKDGKPIIIEGIHLDPSIYLMDEEKRDDNSRMGKTIPDSENSGISVQRKTEHQSKNGLAEDRISPTKENENFVKSKDYTLEKGRISEGLSYVESHETVTHDSAHSQEKNPKDESDGHKDLGQPKNNTAKKDKPAAEPIVVPIVLRMSDFDHKALLEEWIATRAFRDNCLPQDHRKLINNLKLIQDYLCSFESQGLTIVDILANSFRQTLDWLHSYLLQCIERGLLAACSESCNQGGK